MARISSAQWHAAASCWGTFAWQLNDARSWLAVSSATTPPYCSTLAMHLPSISIDTLITLLDWPRERGSSRNAMLGPDRDSTFRRSRDPVKARNRFLDGRWGCGTAAGAASVRLLRDGPVSP